MAKELIRDVQGARSTSLFLIMPGVRRISPGVVDPFLNPAWKRLEYIGLGDAQRRVAYSFEAMICRSVSLNNDPSLIEPIAASRSFVVGVVSAGAGERDEPWKSTRIFRSGSRCMRRGFPGSPRRSKASTRECWIASAMRWRALPRSSGTRRIVISPRILTAAARSFWSLTGWRFPSRIVYPQPAHVAPHSGVGIQVRHLCQALAVRSGGPHAGSGTCDHVGRVNRSANPARRARKLGGSGSE
jgi:hypothetical protein